MNKYLLAGVIGLSLIGYIFFMKWQTVKKENEANIIQLAYAKQTIKGYEQAIQINNQHSQEIKNANCECLHTIICNSITSVLSSK